MQWWAVTGLCSSLWVSARRYGGGGSSHLPQGLAVDAKEQPRVAHVAWCPHNVGRGFQGPQWREPGRSHVAFYDFASEVSQHHFHYILLV